MLGFNTDSPLIRYLSSIPWSGSLGLNTNFFDLTGDLALGLGDAGFVTFFF